MTANGAEGSAIDRPPLYLAAAKNKCGVDAAGLNYVERDFGAKVRELIWRPRKMMRLWVIPMVMDPQRRRRQVTGAASRSFVPASSADGAG